ncbi:sensor histidine kinase [Vitiosangium sp. GDMCC 1.1324]|uniref:sensor histidine kinase n=1 Tax=Vitiosangium sp. (strain GDMCC 1.1324) TaxID=2138576 RepID=UPI000D3AF620|nr:ATP-binding protein [Vitiosangium sp. GDMCC 1.1324]PTL78544.1 two-component sensor histidine kinase [Vitiosangium sp. GDMCC 1.1324]
MKWRIASVAFLFSAVGTGLTWLTLQRPLLALMDVVRQCTAHGSLEPTVLARTIGSLPFLLALDLMLLTLVSYAVLDFMVGRPLRRTEDVVEQLGRLELDVSLPESPGPLLSRIQRALSRMTLALQQEQARLAQAQTELVSAERLATVGRLAAGVAHEVGNPLAGILGYLSLAGARTKDPEVQEYLARIDHEVQRIDGIVRGLLEIGRPGGKQLGPVDVRHVVETCVQLVKAGRDFSHVRMDLALAPGLLAKADSGPLSQIVINLLLNAVQAMDGRGVVRLSTRGEGSDVLLVVEDSGPGIAAEVMPRLFEPFFTTKEPGQGTGLGLAVSLHLAEGMGGKLTAENRPGGGARFSVLLPGV